MNRVNGKDFITACATALEVGMRVGLALGSYRDIKDEKTSMPPVTGHSSGVLGGAAGVAKLEGLSKDQVAQALSMAALISPVQTQTIMHRDLPTNSGKYLMAGWASQVGITAPYLIKAGHRGDIAVLDGDYGYWRFTGSTRWDPESVVNELGKEWRFLRTIPLKQYPCCRMMHGGLECLAAIIQTNKLMPEEIDGIHAYLEATCVEPMFNNPDVINQIDAQFSVAYNMSVLAFGIKPGARWQELNTMTNLEIRRLMGKVTFEPHPEYVKALKTDAHKRISKVEVFARGKIFVEERDYIKGTNTSNPATSIDDEELTAKFKDNASYILPSSKVSQACDLLMDLDNVKDVTDVIESLHL
jgi:2-methylcitrate dehydratase PrpD